MNIIHCISSSSVCKYSIPYMVFLLNSVLAFGSLRSSRLHAARKCIAPIKVWPTSCLRAKRDGVDPRHCSLAEAALRASNRAGESQHSRQERLGLYTLVFFRYPAMTAGKGRSFAVTSSRSGEGCGITPCLPPSLLRRQLSCLS